MGSSLSRNSAASTVPLQADSRCRNIFHAESPVIVCSVECFGVYALRDKVQPIIDSWLSWSSLD